MGNQRRRADLYVGCVTELSRALLVQDEAKQFA